MAANSAKSGGGGAKAMDLPIVIARLAANSISGNSISGGSRSSSLPGTPSSSKGCVVIYGHYDVAFAHIDNDWNSDPWELTGRDGFLFGRGVSDDKGPVLASLFAAKELHDAGKLGVDVVFVIEGEEESGYSLDERSFPGIIAENKHWFEGCKAVVISNNYWVDNERPCLTYGMRGVIDLEMWVHGPKRDLHAGVDGGAVQVIIDIFANIHTYIHTYKHKPFMNFVFVPPFYG